MPSALDVLKFLHERWLTENLDIKFDAWIKSLIDNKDLNTLAALMYSTATEHHHPSGRYVTIGLDIEGNHSGSVYIDLDAENDNIIFETPNSFKRTHDAIQEYVCYETKDDFDKVRDTIFQLVKKYDPHY
jgi:hypothetical protein